MAAFVALRFEATTDITHLLPTAKDQQLAAIARQLADSSLSRTMILAVSGGETPAQTRAGAKALAKTLHADPEIDWLHAGPDEALGKAFYDLYFPHRHGLLSDRPETKLTKRLDDAGLNHNATLGSACTKCLHPTH